MDKKRIIAYIKAKTGYTHLNGKDKEPVLLEDCGMNQLYAVMKRLMAKEEQKHSTDAQMTFEWMS